MSLHVVDDVSFNQHKLHQFTVEASRYNELWVMCKNITSDCNTC